MEHKAEAKNFRLPSSVYSPSLVSGLLRELDRLDNSVLQQLATKKGEHSIKLSPLMMSVVETNKVDIDSQTNREDLKKFLNSVKLTSPVVHISFASDPSASFMQKLTEWFRTQVNPNVLITVGLQPTIGAGCVIRTTNKQFDLSLGEEFTKQREQLISRFSLSVQETGAPAFIPVQAAPKEAGQ